MIIQFSSLYITFTIFDFEPYEIYTIDWVKWDD